MIREGDIKTTKTKDKNTKYWKVTKLATIRWKIIKRKQITRKEYLNETK